MKKTVTLLAVLMLALTMDAIASKLILRIPSNQARLTINGQRYATNNGEFIIHSLRQGRHFIQVSTSQRGRVHHRRGSHRQQFNQFRGKIFVPRESKVFARITPNGRLVIEQVIPIRRYRHQPRTGGGQDFGQNRSSRNQNQYNRNVDRSLVYNSTLRRIEQSSFDSEKLRIAKQYMRTNTLRSQQVAYMMRLLNFESTRLTLAKISYNQVLDPKNYYLVYDSFQFRSSANALDRFI
jgi:hypothetical protein